MSKKMQYLTPQYLGADIPGQAEFISAMEKKVGNLLGSKLTGEFKMLVDPNGFHYGFTYGNNGYYNANSLSDIDRTLVVDETTNQLVFGQQPFSVLYEKILRDTGYHLSSADQERMNQMDIEAQAYTNQLINAFKNDFPSVPLPAETSAIATIFQYITTTYGSIDQVPVYYTATKNALQDYSAHANEAYQQHCAISNAQSRLQSLIGNIDKPSEVNGGMQTDATSYHVGYSVPDFAQTYASLTSDQNKIEILMEFSDFNQEQSQLSIDHQAAFTVPLPICIFGRSETKYTLNSMVTSQSDVTMQMSYSGITTFSPSPASANATATSGWYDDMILNEIIKNTGQDCTGYCLINEEFDVKSMFGTNGAFSRLGEFVICQTPTITLTMTAVDTTVVSECFEHDSELDVSFFGFGISSSQHHYKVENVSIDSQARTATITLSAPKPSAKVAVETEVAYVLGGVASYPPASKMVEEKKVLPFEFALPILGDGVERENLSCNGTLRLRPGNHRVKYYLGKSSELLGTDETLDAVLSIWYRYDPEEKSVWLSDAYDFTSDQTKVILYRKDGLPYKEVSSHSSTDLKLEEKLNTFMEELIHTAEDQGLSVIRRRDIPDEVKDLRYYQGNGRYQALGSRYFGVRNIYRGNVFVNALGTSGDVFIDPSGAVTHQSWIWLWEFVTMRDATECTNCQSGNNLCGAHVLMNRNASVAPTPGAQVDILPLCSRCNNYTNVGQMQAAVRTSSMVMIW